MAEAGPSRPRNTAINANGTSHHTQLPTQKRRKITDVSEIFEKQDVEEQVKLGKQYRALQGEADEMKANLANATADELTKALSKQAELFANVRDTGIGTLDANLIRTNTENAMALAKRFKIDGVAFDIDEFLIKVKGTLGLDRVEQEDRELSSDDELEESDQPRVRKGVLGDWEKIGWMAARYYRRIPGVEFMYGPLAAQPKDKRNIQRQKRQALAPEVRPEEVQNQAGDAKTKDDFSANIRKVFKTLEKLDPERKGINLFKLVVNPDDYGQTVENCFFVSFLLNDGRAGMSVSNEGEILIRPTEPHDAELDGEPIKNQAVVEMDMETWEEAKKTFNIRFSNIPHRDYSAIQMASNKWYS
ncbi:hypothetical protein CI109_104522 [Kwoniella shandongensis]|uniref:Non-structural maintenance of chromosomes element 4 n=1 Tax=Kwoniella shandongensis TaxID=1734106 RepID=A0A5M6BQ63_9TREE|nr:uncharacterized protein CI109_007414 [Kwoniella shandongensis]KAA5524262.1 hypothetical protein CI109_007414 [Kwoniella shandongensis]